MARKIFGWILAGLSIFQFVIFILILFDAFGDEVSMDLQVFLLKNTFIFSLVFSGGAILLLKKKKDEAVKTSSRGVKVRKVFGYILLIFAVLSLTGLQYFDVYEILPRVIFFIAAYFLLRTYKKDGKQDSADVD